MGLGHWAVIDIETTGVNPGTDEIIDLGFYQFHGTKLVKSYSSLVRPNHPVSGFITKLTGITNSKLEVAPPWKQVEIDLMELEGHHLIAHNAGFEKSFLARYFEQLPKQRESAETFQDSLLFLALLFPESPSLGLEYFISTLGISEREEHRGLADSRDLLKVMLVATKLSHNDPEFRNKVLEILANLPEDFWFKNFFALSVQELLMLAEQMEFDLDGMTQSYLKSLKLHKELPSNNHFDLTGFSKDVIQSVLRDEKNIQKTSPGYQFREAQEALATRVGQAFKNKIHAFIQAPTGTGKTMGYLLPAFIFSLFEKEPCLVATGTRALQEQALNKDVPQLKTILGMGEKFKVTKLVGSGNHLCELLFRSEDMNPSFLDSFGQSFTQAYFEMLFFYNSRVNYEKKITREQLPYVLKRMFLEFKEKEQAISVDYRACIGQACPHVGACSYVQGLREAKESHIIVGNHSLMLSWPKSFPRPAYVIVDEAHRLEQEATKAFTIEVNHQNLETFQRNFSQGMGALIYLLNTHEEGPFLEDTIQKIRQETQFQLRLLRDHLDGLPTIVESFFKKLPNFNPLYPMELPFPRKDELKDSLATSILNHSESIHFIFDGLYTLFLPYMERWDQKDFKGDVQKLKAWTVFEANFSNLEKIKTAFSHFLQPRNDWVTVIKFSADEGYNLESAPINVGKMLHDELLNPSSSVVYTSATLANASGDVGVQGVEWMTGYSYLVPEKRFKTGLFLNAVYDYKNKCKVFLSSDTRNLSDPRFIPEMLERVIPIISKLGGRTLLLFSSRLRFEAATEILLKQFDGTIPVFVQGLGKNVVEDFKQAESGILIGMESFGEGIDIPGDRLQFIVVDKIPDVRQELVIQKRRDFFESVFGNEFNDYFLAHRTRSLHQKFGRLIRTNSDHGVILVVDNRIRNWKGGTMKAFQKLMEPYQIASLPLETACVEISSYFKL